jgi:3'-phosphoadenosine 5'-phosphosulfate sulfotransferase (PAPS reductase)/FAD synthetase
MTFYFRRADLRKINKFDVILLTVSGGIDSTYTALQFLKERDFIKPEIILVHNNTGMRIKSQVHTLNKLREDFKQDYQLWREKDKISSEGQKISKTRRNKFLCPYIENYVEITPKVKNSFQIVKDSFKFMDKAKELVRLGKYNKNVFPCCNILKKDPFKQWLQKQELENALLVYSYTRSDSQQRRGFLANKRSQNDRFHYSKERDIMCYYPLRDVYKTNIREELLQDLRYYDTKPSGCSVCPILVLFNLVKQEPKRFIRSKKVYLEINQMLPCKQVEHHNGCTI